MDAGKSTGRMEDGSTQIVRLQSDLPPLLGELNRLAWLLERAELGLENLNQAILLVAKLGRELGPLAKSITSTCESTCKSTVGRPRVYPDPYLRRKEYMKLYMREYRAKGRLQDL